MVITDQAKSFIQELMEEHNAGNIRVFFAGMGWGGPWLGLSLDEATEDDVIEEINGIKVGFDETIYSQTKELTLEVRETPEGKGLMMTGTESDCRW